MERGVVATWCVSGVLGAVKEEEKQSKQEGEAMDVDGDGEEQGTALQVETIQRRQTRLVAATDLEGTLSLPALRAPPLTPPPSSATPRRTATLPLFLPFPPPTQHIYALSPQPLTSLSQLAPYALSSLSDSTRAKWKPAPEGGYGGIVHPEGEMRKKGKAREKVVGVTAPAAAKASAVASTSAAAKTSSTTAPKGKSTATSTSTSSAKASTSKSAASTSKSAAPAPRKIGELGGLFARSTPAPKPDKKEKEKKRKASPPPKPKTVTKAVPAPKAAPKKAGRSNGIFGDEELASDEEFEMDGGDEGMWDEEALREAEEDAARKANERKGSVGGRGKDVEKGKGKGKEVQEKDKDGQTAKERRAKEQEKLAVSLCACGGTGRALNPFFLSIARAPHRPFSATTTKCRSTRRLRPSLSVRCVTSLPSSAVFRSLADACPSTAKKPTAAEKRAAAEKNMKSGNLNSFFGKK